MQAYINHLPIAFGSLMQLETLLKIATELDYLAKKLEKFLIKTEEIGKMLSGLIVSLQKKSSGIYPLNSS